ncbi:hypothetical protein F4780DRAFT_668422 [Xylariomycetidae sp. FL0641]|nr:hypothetical protein F4780DRAFT_668422 [Xylariomycetidae sp. FL0641]
MADHRRVHFRGPSSTAANDGSRGGSRRNAHDLHIDSGVGSSMSGQSASSGRRSDYRESARDYIDPYYESATELRHALKKVEGQLATTETKVRERDRELEGLRQSFGEENRQLKEDNKRLRETINQVKDENERLRQELGVQSQANDPLLMTGGSGLSRSTSTSHRDEANERTERMRQRISGDTSKPRHRRNSVSAARGPYMEQVDPPTHPRQAGEYDVSARVRPSRPVAHASEVPRTPSSYLSDPRHPGNYVRIPLPDSALRRR